MEPERGFEPANLPITNRLRCRCATRARGRCRSVTRTRSRPPPQRSAAINQYRNRFVAGSTRPSPGRQNPGSAAQTPLERWRRAGRLGRHGHTRLPAAHRRARLGISYQVNSKTVIRTAYGIFYNSTFVQELQDLRKFWPYTPQELFTANTGTS